MTSTANVNRVEEAGEEDASELKFPKGEFLKIHGKNYAKIKNIRVRSYRMRRFDDF